MYLFDLEWLDNGCTLWIIAKCLPKDPVDPPLQQNSLFSISEHKLQYALFSTRLAYCHTGKI